MKGEYSLVEADGTLRVVKYTADPKKRIPGKILQ